MNTRAFYPVIRVAGVWIVLASASGLQVKAVEPARKFLDGLRARGYYDVALDYLDRVGTSPLAPVELREMLLYEKGVTLVQSSRTQRDMAIRESRLDEAQQLLSQFVKQHAIHAKANDARSQLGNLIVERARIKVEMSSQGDKQQRLQEALALFEEAFTVFQQLKENVGQQLERIPKRLDEKDAQQKKMIDRRKQLRADYLQAQLLAAAIREETTDALKAGSDESKALLAEAEKMYGEIYKKYRTRLAGLYARMYQGRANQKMGKHKDAIGYFAELLEQPDSPEEFRSLKIKTMRLAMASWLASSEKKYAEAIRRGAPWIAKARPTEDRDLDWLALRMALAKAYKMQADATEKSDPKDARTINKALTESRRLAQFVAKHTSEFQQEARNLVAELGGGTTRSTKKLDPKSFAEAKEAGREALDSIQTATLIASRVPARIAQETDEAEKASLKEQLGKARATLQNAQGDALEYFRMALSMADGDTPLEEVNVVRYFLAYLYYSEAKYYEAALTGNFVAHRYPGSAGARQCAKIAMASFMKLHAENKSDDKQFETARVVDIAKYIADRWPDQAEAEEALSTLVPFMINAGQLDQALEFVERIPETSPKRAEAELKTGQAMWAVYLRGMRDLNAMAEPGGNDGVNAAAKKTELEQSRTQAIQILEKGLSRLEGAAVTAPIVTALLSLAQAYVDSQQADKAVAVLEDENTGPLTLLKNDHPATKTPGLAEEIYKTALRAYISSLATSSQSDAVIEKAKRVMERMKTAIGDSEKGKKRLVAVYVSLARDLESQLKQASPKARTALSKGFETFLGQLSEGATELNVLNWVAETFLSLGGGFETSSALSSESKKYYKQAAATFDKILNQESLELEPQMKLRIRLRKAEAMRRQRKFKDALDSYQEILSGTPAMLNVQVDAAMTYQIWAGLKGKHPLYVRAIMGHRPDPATKKNIIWGWGKIATVTAQYKQYRDTFHKARYNLALCRLRHAESMTGEKRTKGLSDAVRDISLTNRLFGLGDENWTAQYDDLMKRIQTAQGSKRPQGIRALESTKKPKK
ncbi:MAG: hypothetical protein ACC628_00810 [Pirellulaceae bacterium]